MGLPDPAALGLALVLVRHGETDHNRPPLRFQGRLDPPLNDAGRRQVRTLAEASSASAGWRRIVASDLRRAVESATVLAEALGLGVEQDARLAESDRGRWEGELVEDVERSEPDLYTAWRANPATFRFPGGESVREHSERALAVLADLLRGELPALVVSHGGTMRCMLEPSLEHFHDLVVPNAATFAIDGDGRPVTGDG